MRVISGSARGRKLATLEGLDTRPTTDRVKESLFNIILKNIFDADVLDLFAGSGSLGIEALSRGASHCVFVEQNKNAFNILKKNVNNLGFEGKSKLYQEDAFSALKKLDKNNNKFDVVFLDPPYGKGYIDKTIKEIDKLDLTKENTIIISELDNIDDLTEVIGNFEVYRTKKYGRVKLAIWQRRKVDE